MLWSGSTLKSLFLQFDYLKIEILFNYFELKLVKYESFEK